MRSRLTDALRSLRDVLAPRRGEARQPRRPAGDLDLGDVRIEYTPSLDGDPDPGEVVWAWVPFEDDPAQGKDRPVVVIGRDGAMLAGVALTTHGSRHDELVAVGTGSWDRERRASWAKLDRIIAIDPAGVRREGAVLDRRRFDDLVFALRRHHGVVVPPSRSPSPPSTRPPRARRRA
jgi:PemK-like, MazF-like toxin of type II toxin-antitoxin system